MNKVLLVDDEGPFLEVLAPFLERSGFSVQIAQDGEAALQRLAECASDVIVLDVMMPHVDGREVCRRLRGAGNWTPIIMLTQVGGPTERAMSLEEGADDYINKPFDPGELVARIHAVLRRAQVGQRPPASATRLASGDLLIDRQAHRAWLAGQEVPLKAKAFAVLEYLVLHAGEEITRERLLDDVWGWDDAPMSRTVDVRIAELRRHLGDDADRPRFIETVPGAGYRFVGPVEVRA
ncbi:MAG TPA: response regulator transcription factor [Anaerolineae bacterium]|nr:response regulator transcription factor [Anaerolineae bacterium]HOR01368.1 response regulator transcription factor [Anaerolineae bacterium]